MSGRVRGDETTNTVYVANQDDNSISVVDELNVEVTATIAVSSYSQALEAKKITNTVYVNNGVGPNSDNSVSVNNGTTGAVTSTISVVYIANGSISRTHHQPLRSPAR